MPQKVLILLLSVLVGASTSASADQPQSLSASIDGKNFVSDDDTILLVPVKGSFSLQASTAGAASWPPPKTAIDRLSINCNADSLAQPLKMTASDFAPHLCRVSFEQGQPAGSDRPTVSYELDKAASDPVFEITAVRGKVIEGRFAFTMKSDSGKTLRISDGRFVAEDRQL